jgi:hypothetical protein
MGVGSGVTVGAVVSVGAGVVSRLSCPPVTPPFIPLALFKEIFSVSDMPGDASPLCPFAAPASEAYTSLLFPGSDTESMTVIITTKAHALITTRLCFHKGFLGLYRASASFSKAKLAVLLPLPWPFMLILLTAGTAGFFEIAAFFDFADLLKNTLTRPTIFRLAFTSGYMAFIMHLSIAIRVFFIIQASIGILSCRVTKL